MLRSSTIRCTGIHVSPEVVYVVELASKRRRASVRRCARVRLRNSVDMPEALVEENARAALVDALDALRQGGVDLSRPYFALSGTASFIRRHALIPGSDEATRDHLLWEAAQLLESEVGRYTIDTLLTARHGFFIAARQQILELYGVLCQQADIGRPGFDMTTFALCNALESSGTGGRGTEVILHEDGDGVRAVLLRDGSFEGERVCREDEKEPAEHLSRWISTELTDEGAPRRLWRSGDSDDPIALGGFSSVEDLDPFAGVPMSETAEQTLQSSETPPGAWAVAAGLAFRGLADG